MENVICINGTMTSRGNNSSPVPFVGVYIAAATLVCFILICCDMWAGFSCRKLWFPVRFFSLNSVSLTLLSISAKIPVDLTSEMPRVQDQLSKLSGTVFICMVMGFMLPSIGINREFEACGNATALTIFVITVIVNICIQMKTGVIFCFFVEHSIIMACMVLLVVRFWVTAVTINGLKMETTSENENLIERYNEPSMLERLKSCYIRAYLSCPQFLLSGKDIRAGYVSIVCTICFLVFTEAMLRSLVFEGLKFCGGVSDYQWSVWLILATQISTVTVTGSVLGFRWITNAAHVNDGIDGRQPMQIFWLSGHIFSQYVLASVNFPKFVEIFSRYTLGYPFFPIDAVLSGVSALLTRVIRGMCSYKSLDDRTIDSRDKVDEFWFDERFFRKCVDDRERCMEQGRKSVINHLMEMLSTIPPTHVSLVLTESTKLSSLSLLVLVHLATITTPASQSVSLTYVLLETFDIIHFIDSQANIQNTNLRHRYMLASVLWKFGFNWMYVNNKKQMELKNYMLELESQLELRCFVRVVEIFKCLYHPIFLRYEASEVIGSLLNRRPYASTKEWFDDIRQIFVNMLHGFLSQLPIAISNYIAQSPIEENEERVRYCLHLVCKLQAVESYVTMSFPEGTSIVRLIDTGTEGVTENSQLKTIVQA